MTRSAILSDAVRLLSSAKYRNAGTVEFLVAAYGKHYFMEVNPRVQVEHTVTEEITGIDVVQSQILIASGKTLPELGLTQDKIPEPMGCAMQVRLTWGFITMCLVNVSDTRTLHNQTVSCYHRRSFARLSPGYWNH